MKCHTFMKIIILVALLAFHLGCDAMKSQDALIKEAVWKELLEHLKAPSTAKLVDCSVYEYQDGDRKLKEYTETYDGMLYLRIAVHEYSKEKCITDVTLDLNKYYPMNQVDTLRRINTEKPHPDKAQVVFDQIHDAIAAKASKDFEQHKVDIKLFHVFISYDAQNSFGAMLRGSAMATVMTGNPNKESIRVLDLH